MTWCVFQTSEDFIDLRGKGILNEVWKHKLIFVETPDANETSIALENYRRVRNLPSILSLAYGLVRRAIMGGVRCFSRLREVKSRRELILTTIMAVLSSCLGMPLSIHLDVVADRTLVFRTSIQRVESSKRGWST